MVIGFNITQDCIFCQHNSGNCMNFALANWLNRFLIYKTVFGAKNSLGYTIFALLNLHWITFFLFFLFFLKIRRELSLLSSVSNIFSLVIPQCRLVMFQIHIVSNSGPLSNCVAPYFSTKKYVMIC